MIVVILHRTSETFCITYDELSFICNDCLLFAVAMGFWKFLKNTEVMEGMLISAMANLEKYKKTETNSYWLGSKAGDENTFTVSKQSKFITLVNANKLCQRANCYILQTVIFFMLNYQSILF